MRPPDLSMSQSQYFTLLWAVHKSIAKRVMIHTKDSYDMTTIE